MKPFKTFALLSEKYFPFSSEIDLVVAGCLLSPEYVEWQELKRRLKLHPDFTRQKIKHSDQSRVFINKPGCLSEAEIPTREQLKKIVGGDGF